MMDVLRVPFNSIQERICHALTGSFTLDVYGQRLDWKASQDAADSTVQQADRDRLSQNLCLFYSNRRPEDAAFLDTLTTLETTDLDFRLICTMTEMSKSKKEWKGETALIDKEMLCRHLANLQGPIYYIAGPPTMVTAMRETLVSAGVGEYDIRTDEFVGY
jgi:ferredoxin-NADP reductase